jgi:hypothetical protein
MKYLFDSSLQPTLNRIIQDSTNQITAIEPLEPPMVQITKGRHTSQVKLGKLLKGNTSMDDDAIKEYVEEFKEINGDISQYKVKYTQDYVQAYKTPLYAIDSTSCSCMTGMDCVRIYDYDPNLALLTVYKNSQLVARSLVRHDNKTFVRIYIDHNQIKSPIIHAIIRKAGFNTCGNLSGIKLKYIECDRGFVAPYLDGYEQNVRIIDDEYLEVSCHGDIECNTTSGYADNNTCYCDNCGCSTHEDDCNYINDETICSRCVDDNYTYLDSIGEYVHNDNIVRCESDDEYYHIEDDDIIYVESVNKYYLIDDTVTIDDDIELLEDCTELTIKKENGDNYALSENCIESDKEYYFISEGYYIKEQLENFISSIEIEIANIQFDCFEPDNEAKLVEELEYIRGLID